MVGGLRVRSWLHEITRSGQTATEVAVALATTDPEVSVTGRQPYAPDAWHDPASAETGHAISFTPSSTSRSRYERRRRSGRTFSRSEWLRLGMGRMQASLAHAGRRQVC